MAETVVCHLFFADGQVSLLVGPPGICYRLSSTGASFLLIYRFYPVNIIQISASTPTFPSPVISATVGIVK
jgi:hypothetical protein